MKWNSEQLKAINATNQNIVVSASAGAGKTTVLIARLIKRILTDGIKMNEVLAMTFTEAAASEMKKRLLVALSDQIANPNLSEQDRSYAKGQLAIAENAHISTIHAFCKSIIENNYAAIGLNPNRITSIATESDTQHYKNNAFNQVINEALCTEFDQTLALLNFLGAGLGKLEPLKEALFNLISMSHNQIDSDIWFNTIKEKIYPVRCFDDFPPTTKDYLLNHLNVNLKNCIAILCDLLPLVNEKYQSLVNDTMNTLVEALQALPNYQLCFDKILIASKYQHTYRKPASSPYNLAFKKLVSILTDEEDLVSAHNNTLNPLLFSIALAKRLNTAYTAFKEADEKLDFNDLEHLAYRILKANDGLVAMRYRNQFKEVMVDEFQDTNYIQNEIVKLVAKPLNTFRVGDIKQSIYRFRGAQPSLMQTLLADESITKIYLSNNYRSKKTIVDFNNQLFSTLLNVDGLSVNYLELDQQIADLPNQLLENEDVQIHIIDFNGLSEQNDEQETKAVSELKSHYIAQSILANQQNTSYKQFKDYCVLVENHRFKLDLKKAFDAYHIPYFIDDKKGFIHSFSISIIYSYIKLLANPADTISLIAVLTSPLYELDENELFALKPHYFKKLEENGHAFSTDFNQLKKMTSIPEMIRYMLTINDFYEQHINIQEKTNVDLFYQHALQDDTFTSQSFTDYIERILPKNKDSAIPISDEADVVKVMTIHQSKGLQFNVVYLYSQSRVYSMDRSRLTIKDEGIAISNIHSKLPLYTRTLDEFALKHPNDVLDAEEHLRVLYVALTRAKDRLHIVDCLKKEVDETLSFDLITKPAGFTPLILCALAHFRQGYQVHYIQNTWDILKHTEQTYHRSIIEHYPAIPLQLEKIKPSDHMINDVTLNLSGQDFAAIGSLVHEIIERLPHQYPLTIEILENIEPKIDPLYYSALIKLYENPIYQATFKLENYHEYEFTLIDDGKLIHGFIDYIAFGENILIFDFKTDRNVSEDELINRYSMQLNTYRQVMATIFKTSKIECYIYSLSLHKMIVI